MLRSHVFGRPAWPYLVAAIVAVLVVSGFLPKLGTVTRAGAAPIVATSTTSGGANAITAGNYHTCALMPGGAVKCWGKNDYGQLGDGTTDAFRMTPGDVVGISGATALTSGTDHTCALMPGGTVNCWGMNGGRQLGDGTYTQRHLPVDVVGISGATALAAGMWHTCALMPGGTAKCWGLNSEGVLGDGTPYIRSTPVDVLGISGATAITAGYDHTCALMPGGTVKCWGVAQYGELGDGTVNAFQMTPVDVAGISGATAITAGSKHTCALMPGGTAKCWGYNGLGQFGNGTVDNSLTPVDVAGIAGATALTATNHHMCALMPGGTAKCWGYGELGQLGNGLTLNRRMPVDVVGISGATGITAGALHTCASMPGGTIKCWGYNEFGELGDGTNIGRWTPVDVVGLGGATNPDPGQESPRNDPRNIPPGTSPDIVWWDLDDIDQDGLPDYWETNGVWVAGKRLDLAAAGAQVGRKDLFVYIDHEQGRELGSGVYDKLKQAFAEFPLQGGAALHVIEGNSVPSEVAYDIGWKKVDAGNESRYSRQAITRAKESYGFTGSGWGGEARKVPQLAKYFVNLKHRNSTDGNVTGMAEVGGSNGWVDFDIPSLFELTIGHGNPFLGDAMNFSAASNLMHEIGHTLGLRHFGDKDCSNAKEREAASQAGRPQPECNAGSPEYKSVMSYAYNITGVGEKADTRSDKNKIEYSRRTKPHYDYNIGTENGKLRFLEGQFGLKPDFYLPGFGMDDSAYEAVSEYGDDMVRDMSPSAFDAFAEDFDITERPDFPEFDAPVREYEVTGASLTAELAAHDRAGSALTLATVQAPEHGTFTTNGLVFVYTPDPGYTGPDTVAVRAQSAELSSEPLTLTFTTQTAPPGTGSGSFGS